jgi:hypothetical protein
MGAAVSPLADVRAEAASSSEFAIGVLGAMSWIGSVCAVLEALAFSGEGEPANESVLPSSVVAGSLTDSAGVAVCGVATAVLAGSALSSSAANAGAAPNTLARRIGTATAVAINLRFISFPFGVSSGGH